MKSKIIKPFSLVMAVIALCSVFYFSASAASTKKVTSGDFVFSVGKSSATLVEYKGNDAKVTIPKKVKNVPVTAIGDYAFWQNKKMTSISIPSTVKSIGEAAFNECTSLKKVVFPKSLTKVKSSAFWYCTNLQSVLINEKASSFGKNVFKGCSKLTVYVYKGTKGETFAKKQSGIKVGYRYTEALNADKTQSVETGKTKALGITTTPSILYNKSLSYSSSNSKVVSVTSKGVIKGLQCGTATITATAKDGSKKSIKIKVTVTPQKVTSVKQSKQTATSYTLSWAKSTGASKYRIYRYNASTKKWETLANTSSTYYTVKNLSLGSSAKYRIKAYTTIGKKTYYASSSATFTASVLKPGTVTGVAVSAQTANSISLKWTKDANASGYTVYSYNASTKKYTSLGNTTNTYYTVKNLSANTFYTFVVKAYIAASGKTLYANNYSSSVYGRTLPGTISGLRAVDSDTTTDKLSVTWNKVSGVSGYELSYQAAGDSTWKSAKFTQSTNTFSLSSLSNDTAYNFKIRAFATASGKTYYGSYSQVVTIRTAALPKTAKDALNAFDSALTKTLSSKDDLMLFVKSSATASEKTLDLKCESVISDIESMCSNVTYTFEDGKETESGISLKQVISPDSNGNDFSTDMVDTEKLSYTLDGSGYSLEFFVNDENGCVFTPAVDWTALSQKHGFTLESVNYETLIDNTKVKNDRLDNMKATVSFTAVIKFDDEEFTLNGTLSYFYIFIWD